MLGSESNMNVLRGHFARINIVPTTYSVVLYMLHVACPGILVDKFFCSLHESISNFK